MPFTDPQQITQSLDAILTIFDEGDYGQVAPAIKLMLVDLHRLIEPVDIDPGKLKPMKLPRPVYGADVLGVRLEKITGLYERIDLVYRSLSPTASPKGALAALSQAREFWLSK